MADETLSLSQFNERAKQVATTKSQTPPPAPSSSPDEMSLGDFAAHAQKVQSPKTEPEAKAEPGKAADGIHHEVTAKSLALGGLSLAATIGDMAIGIPGGIAGPIAAGGMYAEMLALGINRKGAAEESKAFGDYVTEASSPHVLGNLVAKLAESTGEKPTPNMIERGMTLMGKWMDQGAEFIDTKSGHRVLKPELEVGANLLMNILGAKGLGKFGPKVVLEDGIPKVVRKAKAAPEAPKETAGTKTEGPIDPADGHPKTAAFEAMQKNMRTATKAKFMSDKDLAQTHKAFTQFKAGEAEAQSQRAARSRGAKQRGATDPKLLAVIGGATTGALLAHAYPEKQDDAMAFALGLSSLGIGPSVLGEHGATIGSLLDKGANTTKILERLPKDKTDIPMSQLTQELARDDITKSEKDMFQSALQSHIDTGKKTISASELVDALHKASGRFTLKPEASGMYADYGLENINRDVSENMMEMHPQELIQETNQRLADPTLHERANGALDAQYPDFPFTGEEARAVRLSYERDLKDAQDSLAGLGPEATPHTTIWNSPEKTTSTNHFNAPNYFAHSRHFTESGTPHVVEIQSDLIQKTKSKLKAAEAALEEFDKKNAENLNAPEGLWPRSRERQDLVQNIEREKYDYEENQKVKAGPLGPMWNNWEKRIIREHLAQEARIGGDKVRFATADTMAKVEGWPTRDWELEVKNGTENLKRMAGQEDHPIYKRSESDLEHARQMLEKKGPGVHLRNPEHQSIYDRHKQGVEKFTKSLGGKEVTDRAGHTWIEVPTGIKPEEVGIYAVDHGPEEGVTYHRGKEAADKAYVEAYPEGDGPQPKRFDASNVRPTSDILRDMKPLKKRIEESNMELRVDKNNVYAMRQKRYAETAHAALVEELTTARAVERAGEKGPAVRAQMFGRASTDMMKTIAGLAVGVALAEQYDQENPIVAGVIGGLIGIGAAHLTTTGVKGAFKAMTAQDTRIRINTATEAHEVALTRAAREVAKFTFAMTQAVPKKADRVLIHQAIDQGKVAALPKHLQAPAALAQKFYSDIAAEAQKAGILDQARANYSTHLWADKTAAQNILARKQASMSGNSRFNKQRAFLTMAEGKAAGLTPLTEDIAEVATIYGNSMARTMANAKLLEDLHRSVGPKGEALVGRPGSVPKDYVFINNPALQRYRVHPDIAPSLKYLFEQDSPDGIIAGLNAVNVALKRNAVSYSLFHAKSLIEAGIVAGHPLKAGKVALQAAAPKIFGVNRYIEELRKGGVGDHIDTLLRGGLKLSFERGEPTDIDVGGGFYQGMKAIQGAMDKALPYGVGKGLTEGYVRANHAMDNFMWARLHAGLKLEVASAKMEALMTNAAKRGKPLSKGQAARLASSYTNDVFGGLNWQRLAEAAHTKWGRDVSLALASPRGRMALNVLLFAPDWALSTTRAFYKALPRVSDIKHPIEAAKGLVRPISDVDLYRQQIIRLGFYYGTAMNALNVSMSGHNIWENKDPTRIELGDGRSIQAMKHSFEAIHLMMNPGQAALSKLGMIPKEAMEQALGVEYLSAKGRMPPMQNRAQHLLSNVVPIGAQQAKQGPFEAGMGMLGAPVYGRTIEQKRQDAKERRERKYRERIAAYKKANGL